MVDITVVSWSRLGKLSVTELIEEFHLQTDPCIHGLP